MIELTPDDVAVILRHASMQELDYMPVAELNDDGQNEIIRWIESVGKLDDQLTPYAWFSLATEAAASHDPDDEITIEMLPTYTLSGESETLEMCRSSHFDWSIEAVPVEYIQNAEQLIDAGVPVRLLLLAEAAGDVFTEHMIEVCPDVAEYEPQLRIGAINAFFMQLCASAGVVLDEPYESYEDEDMDFENLDEAEFAEAIEECIEEARDLILSLDPELGASLPETPDMLDRQWFKVSSLLPPDEGNSPLILL
jgi:hypothetical protein